jgi:prepilin-type N-terminal cleavage/methylation domain-containing protein/prepilin-type processing-associated H-X9-DG protein
MGGTLKGRRMVDCKRGDTKRVKRGFTLIELLVVIAIIAVLLAVLMPAMRKIKEIARQTVCRANLKNVGLAVQMYLDDYNRKIPNTGSSNQHQWFESNGLTYRRPGSSGTYWGIYYRDYIKDQTKIFGCPSFQNTAGTRLIYTYSGSEKSTDSDYIIQHAAFGLNHHTRARGPSDGTGRNVDTIYRPSEFIYCLDHAEPRPDGGTSDCLHNNNNPGSMNLTSYRAGGSRSYSYRQIFRHNVRYPDPYRTGGRTNVLWVDAHVSYIEETTGDDVPLSYYTGDKEDRF